MKTMPKKTSWFTTENVAAAAFITAVALAPTVGLAANANDFTQSGGGACTFVKNIHTILNLISIAVVTIAIIFAGYQIAFAHKRIADVAPILIGGVLIGAAGQIARMLVSSSATDSCAATTAAAQILQYFV